MLYFPVRSAGNCGFTTAFLNLVANGLAVVPLSPSICSGSRSISCIKAGNAVTSCACPGVITTPIGRPSALVRALILVEKPPRERPSALRSVPPFRQPRNDARG